MDSSATTPITGDKTIAKETTIESRLTAVEQAVADLKQRLETQRAESFETLVAPRLRIASMDLRIAAIALSRNLILLTRNVRDFARVPGLLTENRTV